MQEEYLTRRQAADLLQCCPHTITNILHEMREKKTGGIIGAGRLLRINKQVLIWYMTNRRTK